MCIFHVDLSHISVNGIPTNSKGYNSILRTGTLQSGIFGIFLKFITVLVRTVRYFGRNFERLGWLAYRTVRYRYRTRTFGFQKHCRDE